MSTIDDLSAQGEPAMEEHIEAALWALDADRTDTAEFYLWQALGYREVQIIHKVLSDPSWIEEEAN